MPTEAIFSSLVQFSTPDSGIEVGNIWHDGANLYLWCGGQTRGWNLREKLWVHDRLPGGPHEEKHYSGFWGMHQAPPRTYAQDLAISGMTLESTANGFPLARVSAATALTITASLMFLSDLKTAPVLEWQIFNCTTGSLVQTHEFTPSLSPAAFEEGAAAAPVSDALSALGAGSYLLRFRVKGGTPSFAWPPPDFQAKTGLSPTDVPLRWTHPTYGVMYYYPRTKTGMRPYDETNATQAELLAQEAEHIANGTAYKVPEWSTYLYEFNSDGTPVSDSGEYSMLRIVAGGGSWIGDSNVHANATLPALWRLQLNSDLTASGVLTPFVLDPCLRNVGDIEVVDGELWIGGGIATRSGPAPVFYRIQKPSDAANDESSTQQSVSVFLCECALPLGKSINSVTKVNEIGRMVSPCDSFKHDASQPLNYRLIPEHPGGRNATMVQDHNGFQRFFFSTEGLDFATSQFEQDMNGYVVFETPNGKKTGAPLAKQLNSCLTSFGSLLYGVGERNEAKKIPHRLSTEERAKQWQYLGSSNDGSSWQPLKTWQKSAYDMGPLCRHSTKREGAALWVFGTKGEGSAMRGVAGRYNDGVWAENINCSYFIQRAKAVAYNRQERMVCVGLKYDSGWSRTQHALIDAMAGNVPDGEPTDGLDALDNFMPANTAVSIIRLDREEWESIYKAPIPAVELQMRVLKAGETDVLKNARDLAAYPYLWLRVDAAEPLEIAEGATLTSLQRDALAEFDQPFQLEQIRSLALPAELRVEALILLPPDYSLTDEALRPREIR